MGRVSTYQKNCKTIDLRGAQVKDHFWITCLSYILGPNMCGFQYIYYRVLWSRSDTKL